MSLAVANAVRRHSLGWLVVANLVGLLLTPLTYGRWPAGR